MKWSNFMCNEVEQFSRWGAPKEQRDEVAADIWELAHKWMQALQTERTQVRVPQLFSWNGSNNGSRQWQQAMPAERGFSLFSYVF
jgi:hypothetical protein